jgi:hypothetical protein
MADSKISALPASTTPLTGTEVLPIVQNSTTKQVSVANLTAGRAISATQLTLTTGNVIVANGQGVDFSATPGTGTSELFADYEEGTFTPTVIGTSTAGTATYAVQLGKYTKVGRLVTVEIYVNWSSGTGTGSLTVGNFPFTIGSNVYGSASIWGEISLTALNYLSNRMLAGGTAVDLFNAPVGGGVTNPVAYQASGSLMITATYST